MRAAALALSLLLTACAAPRQAYTGPTYTKAALEALPTAELAAMLLPPADAARIERHRMTGPDNATSPYWTILFEARPRPVGNDICARDRFSVPLVTLARPRNVAEQQVAARRIERVYPHVDLMLAPHCRGADDRRYARLQWQVTEDQAVVILRWLAYARAAAASSGALPFRLTCLNYSHRGFECPADLRAALAAVPLDRAATIDRQPFPHNCDHSIRDEGDAIEIADPRFEDDGWDIRLRHMGTDRAEVVMIRQFPRTRVVC